PTPVTSKRSRDCFCGLPLASRTFTVPYDAVGALSEMKVSATGVKVESPWLIDLPSPCTDPVTDAATTATVATMCCNRPTTRPPGRPPTDATLARTSGPAPQATAPPPTGARGEVPVDLVDAFEGPVR